MALLDSHLGDWAGTNGFRLMPTDAFAEAPMRASVAPAAKGGLVRVEYTWAHPADGEQEGLLLLGPGDEDGSVVAFWGDSWHQQPSPRALEGRVVGAVVSVGYSYGGDWRWEIAVDASAPDSLTITMRNVIPASAATPQMEAGPYAAMQAPLLRSS